MCILREYIDDPDIRISRRIGLVNNAKRRFSARHQSQSGTHILWNEGWLDPS